MQDKEWILTVWGVRGSVPVPSVSMMEYGGNTSCFSIEAEDELIILDAGSGLVPLGVQLARQNRPQRAHILLSHLHLDHLIGLFGFRPFHNPDMEFHLYGEVGLRQRLERLAGPPYWPLELKDYPARLVLHEVKAGERFSLPGDSSLTVRTLRGNHPNQSLLYRLESGEKSITYTLDCELNGGMSAALAAFAQKTNLLIWDANFAPPDLRPGWGHSTWEQGIALGRASGAGTVLMAHYSWEYNDDFLREQERLAKAADPAVCFAKERMEIRL